MPDLTEPDAHLADEVIQLLVAMSSRMSQHFAARAVEVGLSAAEGKVLLVLESGETLSMRAIARRLGYDASNLTVVVDKLEARGAVERHPEPADRRVKAISATDRGRQVGERLADRLRSHAGPVRSLTDAQLRDLRALLRQAIDSDRVPADVTDPDGDH